MSPLPLGIVSASGSAQVETFQAFDLLSTTYLNSETASVSFNNLDSYAATYKHLQMRAHFYATSQPNMQRMLVRLNGSNGLFGDISHGAGGSSSSTGSSYGQSNFGWGYYSPVYGTNTTANAFIIDIFDFANPNKKPVFHRQTAGFYGSSSYNPFVRAYADVWNQNTAVNSIQFVGEFGNIVAPSKISIYGIKGDPE